MLRRAFRCSQLPRTRDYPSYRLRQLGYGVSLRREIREFYYNFYVRKEVVATAAAIISPVFAEANSLCDLFHSYKYFAIHETCAPVPARQWTQRTLAGNRGTGRNVTDTQPWTVELNAPGLSCCGMNFGYRRFPGRDRPEWDPVEVGMRLLFEILCAAH